MKDVRFRNPARDRTVATPRKLCLSFPVLLNQEALMTIASDPDVRGAENTAYELTPEIIYPKWLKCSSQICS